MIELERIPAEEATQIENITRLTIEQLKKRYLGEPTVRRGVHPKDHGCVTAKFKVHDALPADLRVGVFAVPGHEYDALIRFSNANVRPTSGDSPKDNTGVTKHGSRGMAVKLLEVGGTPLVPPNGPLTQDFVMLNHPVFAFSNVEDYEALSQVLLKDEDEAGRFFAERIHRKPDGKPDLTDATTRRALTTRGIVQRIQSTVLTAPPTVPPVPPTRLRTKLRRPAPSIIGISVPPRIFSATNA